MSHRRLKAATFCCVVCIVAGAAATLGATRRDPHTVPSGVRVGGMSWGGKAVAEVRGELQSWATRIGDPTLILRAAGPAGGPAREWRPRCSQVGLSVDVERTVRAALAVGQDEGIVRRLVALLSGRRPVDLPVVWRLDEVGARRYLARVVGPAVQRPARDARYLANEDGSGRVEPEQVGAALDADAALARIRTVDPLGSASPIDLPVRVVPPRITAAHLSGIEGEVARFRTHYAETGNRARNIAVACRRINGTVLLPGDVFSYNAVVGPRERGAGFRMAPVIVRGKLEDGMGGGVCQVSTTLYNAALLADLQIVSRTHHAFPVHYVPAGRDATVAYGSIDFRFRNNTDAPIVIAADGSGGRVLMRILGKPMPGRQVRLERTGVETTDAPVKTTPDPRLPLGKRVVLESGRVGHRARLWRVVFVNGKRVKREPISSDSYAPSPRLVAVGVAPVHRPAPGSAQPPMGQPIPASSVAPAAPSAAPARPTASGGT